MQHNAEGHYDERLELNDQVAKVGERWVELELVLFIIAGLQIEYIYLIKNIFSSLGGVHRVNRNRQNFATSHCWIREEALP